MGVQVEEKKRNQNEGLFLTQSCGQTNPFKKTPQKFVYCLNEIDISSRTFSMEDTE